MLLEALAVASKCQAQFVLICGTGVLGAQQGTLDAATLKNLTRFYLRYLMPCVVLQLNQVFTLERTLEWSPVILAACAHIALGAALGRGCAWLLGLRTPHKECMTLISAFGNCGSLPFVLVLPVVTGWSRTAADLDAFGKGMALIGLYLTAWVCIRAGFEPAGGRLRSICGSHVHAPPNDGSSSSSFRLERRTSAPFSPYSPCLPSPPPQSPASRYPAALAPRPLAHQSREWRRAWRREWRREVSLHTCRCVCTTPAVPPPRRQPTHRLRRAAAALFRTRWWCTWP